MPSIMLNPSTDVPLLLHMLESQQGAGEEPVYQKLCALHKWWEEDFPTAGRADEVPFSDWYQMLNALHEIGEVLEVTLQSQDILFLHGRLHDHLASYRGITGWIEASLYEKMTQAVSEIPLESQ